MQHLIYNPSLFATTILQFFTKQAFLFVEVFGLLSSLVGVVALQALVVDRVAKVPAYS